jgi:aldehyde:ferredoxin oxidoreductase
MTEAAAAGPEISPEISRFDAENATALTADFLKRLGYKGSWLPMKVALDGELYVVEMMLQKLSAKVQINSKTKEIKEYEFQKGENEQGGLFSKNKIMFLITAVSLALMVTKLIGVF